jgi:colanic acid/amylovoran biosynthesis protein
VLIPHVFGEGPGSESDVVACEEVYRTLQEEYSGRLGVLRGTYNESEVKYAIGCCDFVVASRMHACIAALSQCVPAMALAYSDKFTGVMKTLTEEPLVLDARHMGSEQILEALDAAFVNRLRTRRMLESIMPQVKETLLSTFGTVRASFGEAAGLATSGELA